jgi:hypothetical protein
MDTTHPTAGWEQVGDKWFRKIQLYTAVFDQDLELDNYIVAGAPFGGALGASISFSQSWHGSTCRWSTGASYLMPDSVVPRHLEDPGIQSW